MAITIFISFITLFFSINIYRKQANFVENSFLTAIVFSLLIVVSNELASNLNQLNFTGIFSFWLVVNGLLLVYIRKNKQQVAIIFNSIISIYKSNFSQANSLTKGMIITSTCVIILIFFQGIIYPPNNWDSMSYHLPRTYQWMNHQNFDNFQTHIVRQLYQPCFSEYVTLQINTLNGNDYFSNTTQFIYYIFSIIAVVNLLRLLNVSKKIIFPAIFFLLTIPEAILEASSTQNDIVHSFFIVASIYFCIKIIKESTRINFAFLGVTVGLALLSKAIAYVYIPVIGLFFAIGLLIKIIKEKEYKSIIYSCLTMAIIILINVGHSCRNYQFSKDIMGTDKQESKDYLNEEYSVANTFSIALKNVGLHLDPLFIGNKGNIILEKTHLLLGLDINKKGTNVFDVKFTCIPGLQNHEDFQPNFIHLILMIGASVLLIFSFLKSPKERGNQRNVLYLLLIAGQFLLFCTLLSWEPWNTRLHIPLFFAAIPIICFAFEKYPLFYKFRNGFIILLLIQAFYIILLSYSRPYITQKGITSKITLNDSRYKKYFANQLEIYPDYKEIKKMMLRKNIKSVGLINHNDTWEYPLYADAYQNRLEVYHLNVTNYSKNIPQIQMQLDAIFSNTINRPEIKYKNRTYINSTRKNKTAWLYLQKQKM